MKWLIGILAVVLVVLQYRLWVGEGSIAEVTDLQHRIKRQRAEITQLQERNNLLALEVQELKSGMEIIEERARSEMGMIKEGETFYMVVEKDKQRDASANPPQR